MSFHAEEELSNQYLGFTQMPTIFLDEKLLLTKQFDTNSQNAMLLTSSDVALINKHIYLGKRAEYFMLNYLRQQEQFSNVMHSIQIQDDKTTLGEIDFLFFDETNQKWIHLELVTKFYIYNSGEIVENYRHWIGPNLKDKFEYKLKKLKHHQLQLLNLPEAKTKLNELEIDVKSVLTKVCFKAKLFLPFNLKGFQQQVTNPKCVSGMFFNLEYFKSFQFKNYFYLVPQKLDWVSVPMNQLQWYDFQKALRILSTSIKEKRSCLLWRKNNNGVYFEDFVVWW